MARPCLPALRLMLLATLGIFSQAVNAQYPDKPIRLIVPFVPGGSTTIVGAVGGTASGEELTSLSTNTGGSTTLNGGTLTIGAIQRYGKKPTQCMEYQFTKKRLKNDVNKQNLNRQR